MFLWIPGLALFFWLIPTAVAAAITSSKGRGILLGLLLGFFLNWIGVIIALLVSEQPLRVPPPNPPPGWQRVPSAAYRECPHCRERMRRDARVCPHCRNESEAWTFKDGFWWCKTDGSWNVLDEKQGAWRKWDAEPPGATVGPPTDA
ncbi:MAG: hypothetical protein ABSC51_08350 [Gaiellaceae bacterium]|jgi:hypothetical protein